MASLVKTAWNSCLNSSLIPAHPLATFQRWSRWIIGGLALLLVSLLLWQREYDFVPAVILPEQTDVQKALVVAAMADNDLSWLDKYISGWEKHVYIADRPDGNNLIPKNKGREAMIYLTYIIDNYAKLPDVSVFIHGERYQWHNDNPLYDGVPMLESLRIEHVLAEGYANLRCVWVLGCPAEVHPYRGNPKNKTDSATMTSEAYAAAYAELFPGKKAPETIGTTCCAQFAVTRSTVLRRPVKEYMRYRDWLLTTELEDSVSGRIMEYSWHIIFGKDTTHCPNVEECYCKLYGVCNIEVCHPEQCDGRWFFPPASNLPKGWPLVGWEGETRTPDYNEKLWTGGLRNST